MSLEMMRDRVALLVLRDAVRRSSWPERAIWDADVDLARWHGVRVGVGGRVVTLELDFEGVGRDAAGFIPPELGHLGKLETLCLVRASFCGSIPSELCGLCDLTVLQLTGRTFGKSGLTGVIPLELKKLEKLRVLDLRDNKLSGLIPTWLGELVNLEEILLARNKLQGRIPRELASLGELKKLHLGSNKLEGIIPAELGELEDLWMLNLSRNRLEGVIPAGLGKLRHLEQLDLSQNSLEGGIPRELGEASSLVKLALNANLLEGVIPSQLGHVRELERLNLSRNRLEGVIPAEIGKLGRMKQLDLSHNHLGGVIPSALGSMGRARQLVLSRNRLGGIIPGELGELEDLEQLDLSLNNLSGVVPWELSKLRRLEQLDLSHNNLEGLWNHTRSAEKGRASVSSKGGGRLPQRLEDLLAWLEELERKSFQMLLPNPFSEPPEAVAQRGVKSIREYYKALYAEGFVTKRRNIKAVIVGQEGAGKTSLRQSIRDGKPCPTVGPKESTVHIDIESVDLGDVALSLYDCAGQVAYYGLLQMFVTRQAVCLLACDASEFDARGRDRGREQGQDEDAAAERLLYRDVQALEELGVLQWLRCLSWRVPGCDVILVATKCDLLSKALVGSIAERIEKACLWWLQSWAGPRGGAVNVESGVSLTSCALPTDGWAELRIHVEGFQAWLAGLAGGSGMMGHPPGRHDSWPCDVGARTESGGSGVSLLRRITHSQDADAYRGISIALPRGWDIALNVLEALSKGRDPIYSVRRRLKLVEGAEGRAEGRQTRKLHGGVARSELIGQWRAVVSALEQTNGVEIHDPDHALEGALCIREFEGYLLQHGSDVFLDVTWLAAVLKPVLHHKELETPDGRISLGNTGGHEIVLSQPKHKALWRRLKRDGVLDPELARVLWPGGLSERVLRILASIGLTFPLPGDVSGRLVVPLRLPMERSPAVGEDLESFQVGHSVALRVAWKVFLGVPPGAVEKVLTKCSALGAVSTFWRFGVLVKGDLREEDVGGTFALLLEYSHEERHLVIEVYGDEESATPWAALSFAMSAVRYMTLEFPGLPWEAFLDCPKHGEEQQLEISHEARRPGDPLLEGTVCGLCSLETGGLGALAAQLLKTVDVTLPRGSVFREVKQRFTAIWRDNPAHGPEYARASADDQPAALEIIRGIQGTFGPDLSAKLDGMLEELQQMRSASLEQYSQAREMRSLVKDLLDFVKSDDGVRVGLGPLTPVIEGLRGDQFDTPALACVLPPWEFQHSEGLSGEEQSSLQWMRRLEQWREDDFREGKGWFAKTKRLFLVCARTYRLVPCGNNGQGYEMRSPRTWLRRAVGGVSIVLEVTCATLGAVAAARLPSTLLGDAIGGGLESAKERLASEMQARLQGILVTQGGELARQREDPSPSHPVRELKGRAYATLREFIREAEDTARSEIMRGIRRARRNPNGPRSAPKFVFFEAVMDRVPAMGTGAETTVQWVFKDKENARSSMTGC